jgi:AcrR family transcriptional regulator
MARTPQQKRAIATADAIIDAAFIAVARSGLTGTNTNKIAELAGISVGSLYEYYANKEAIYDAMQARVVKDAAALIGDLINELVKLEIRPAITLLLKRFEQFLLKNEGRYLKYAQNTLGSSPALPLEPLVESLRELLIRYLMAHPRYLRARNIPTISYIMINGGMFTVLRHLSDPNPPISFAELSAGLADMVNQYVLAAVQSDTPSP